MTDGILQLRENSDYDAATKTMHRRWQVLINGSPVTPIEARDEVRRRLESLADEARALADALGRDVS
jgi:hypothetical protein